MSSDVDLATEHGRFSESQDNINMHKTIALEIIVAILVNNNAFA